MSAQPDHAPITPYAPSRELLPSCSRGCALTAAHSGGCRPSNRSRRTFSLAVLYEVVQVGQARVTSAPVVDALFASGRGESGFVDLEEIRGRRR
ncbi:hypothetical protein [Streptomyces sp. NBC_00299]|uniref:hypothetical protein n=1 Tax=Streptomyces sp. NBC_00299 TaxID=2975705 RepID=UPI002E2DE710|nr:hypothetical protein [Streptomyces sp. NBC_00299]